VDGADINARRLGRGSEGKPYVYAGTAGGHGARFNRTAYTDLGTGSIRTVIETKGDDFDEPESAKGVGDAYIALQGAGGGAVAHTVVLDDGTSAGQTSLLDVPEDGDNWGPTGAFTWNTSSWNAADFIKRHRVPGTGDSTTVGHRFVRDGTNNPFFLLLVDQHIKRTGETQDQEANTVA